jgi:O-antigen/teichoic acid export membrane protein
MATLTTASTVESDARVPQTGEAPRFSHTLFLTASQGAKWSLRLVFVAVIARAMGPEKFGTYALIFAMVEFLAVASGAGYADYLTREAAKDERAGWGLALQLMLLRVAIAIPVAAIEIGILSLMRYPHAVLAGTAWMAVTIIPRSLSEAVQGVLRGIHRYGSFLAIELVLGGGLVAGAVVLFLRHGGLSMAIWTEVFAAAAAGVAGLAFLLKFKTSEPIWLSRSDLVRRGSVFNVYSFVATLYDRFDVVLLSRLAGDYALGIYAVAYRALLITQIVPYSVLYSLLPTLSRNWASKRERARLEKAMGLLLSAAFVVVLATMVFAGPAVLLLLGPRYAESAVALKILIWAAILRYANYGLNISLLAAGRERVFMKTFLVCLAVNFVGNLIFIPMYSWRAAAFLTIVTELVLLVQNLYWIRRTAGEVAVPWSIARTSCVFIVLLTLASGGAHFGSPMAAGTLCLLVFAAYLFFSGMLAEFAGTWGGEKVAAE